MSWNLAPESISTVILCIVWIYSRKGSPTPDLKSRLFQACFLTTFCAMTSNIIATTLLFWLTPYTLWLTWAVNMVYFIVTPLMGMVYCFYTMAYIFDNDPKIFRYLAFAAAPGILYAAIIILNPFNHLVFGITMESGYTQGPLISLTYIIFYFYCGLCVVFAVFKGRRVSSSIRTILLIFPIIAALVIIIQMMIPNFMLTGTAATCAMLLIYLYLQNKQISIDYLTKLPNRHEFLKMVDLRLKKEEPFAVLVLSLRQFKHINDTYGQHSGDAILAAISAWMRKELGLRENALFRYSGDEFALIFDNVDTLHVERLKERITSRMNTPWTVKNCTCILSYAAGWVCYPATSTTAESLINGLEYAVSLAKHGYLGSNICYCTPALLEKAKRRQAISEILLERLQTDGFDVYYQPIVTVNTDGPEAGAFLFAEALLRIHNSPLGSISPGEFIPIAEESGLIVEITYQILEKVCACLKRFLDLGILLNGISVNFSALQFTQEDLIPRITEIITRHGVPFSMVKIEITESTLTENNEAVMDYMQQMHDLGIRIALDDFGTGYSNLTSVISMPIDIIKLDKSLIWSSIDSDRFSLVVQHLTFVFQQLGVVLLAEGVEDQAQSDFAVSCGCSHIQGFLYARPMPEQDFERFLREKNSPRTFS